MQFAFGDLLEDIGSWLMLGILLAGLIGVFLSPGLIEAYLGDGLFSMVVMLALATPLYVCATASTPIAAALVLKGLSPGAALVFLLAGPATNVATITVVTRLLGKRTTIIYISTILVTSLFFGVMVDAIYDLSGFSITDWQTTGAELSHGVVAYVSTLILLLLIGRGFVKKLMARFKKPELIQLV